MDLKKDAGRLREQAMKLPPEARAAPAGSILESLDEPLEPSAEAAWEAEIAKRQKELDGGRVRTVPWSEARRAIIGS